jgi:hypothetical protein
LNEARVEEQATADSLRAVLGSASKLLPSGIIEVGIQHDADGWLAWCTYGEENGSVQNIWLSDDAETAHPWLIYKLNTEHKFPVDSAAQVAQRLFDQATARI